MNLGRNYQDCFWTASGELDCQSSNQTGNSNSNWNHSYHVPQTGMLYQTESTAQTNQNLGFMPRSCQLPNPSARIPGFQPKALTQFKLPRAAQANTYQSTGRAGTPCGGRMAPNCAASYARISPARFKPMGNQVALRWDSEARYNSGYGGGCQQTFQQSTPQSPQYGYGSTYQAAEGPHYSASGSLTGSFLDNGGGNAQTGENFQQSGGSPYSSLPADLHNYSLIGYKAPILAQDLGDPDVVDTTHGGIAMWKEHTLRDKLGGIFKRVELHDEKVPNLNPVPYLGNVYTWVKIAIRSDVFRDVLDMFPNVWYDRQKRWLSIRTDTLDNNIATLALICLINNGTVSIRHVSQYDLARKYLLSICPRSRHFNRYCKATYLNIIKRCILR